MIALMILIALAFIGLGLNEPLLGSAWPSMYGHFGVDAAAAGTVLMITSVSTIIASYLSARIISRFGTGMVLTACFLVMGTALFGVSLSGHFVVLCLLAIPLGFSAGSIDAGSNGFLTTHYDAKYLNWIHCLWGIGATGGPALMAFSLMRLGGWTTGYRIVGTLQLILAAILLVSLPRWKKAITTQTGHTETRIQEKIEVPGIAKLLRLQGAPFAILLFFFLGGLEGSLGLWSNTYLVMSRGILRETATSWFALYYLALTLGRLFSGFLAIRRSSRQIATLGLCLIFVGLVTIALPFAWSLRPGLIITGLGAAPLFPNFIHLTPGIVGKGYTQAMVGLQITAVFLGVMTLPPLFGLIGRQFGYGLFPLYVGVLLLVTAGIAVMLYRRHPDEERQ